MGETSIEWCDAVWNPVRGCSRVSPGCDNCYAMRQAHRFDHPGRVSGNGVAPQRQGKAGPYHGLTRIGKRGVDWSGVVRFVPEQLDLPLRWRKPRRIFVNSMSDLFHESLSNEQIAAVFGVMAAARQHTFQVLTKRPERMRQWFEWTRQHKDEETALCQREAWIYTKRLPLHAIKQTLLRFPWPLTNVLLGVSAEDQKTADARIPELLRTPAAVRFVSAEPLIGPLDLDRYMSLAVCVAGGLPGLDWVIVGGESGRGARLCEVEWIRSIVTQCRDAEVPVFVKQLGAKPVFSSPLLNFVATSAEGKRAYPNGAATMLVTGGLVDPKGGDPSEWPEDLRVREFPTVAT